MQIPCLNHRTTGICGIICTEPTALTAVICCHIAEDHELPPMALPQLHYLKPIAHFILTRVIQGNKLLLSVSVTLGITSRLMLLAGFGMTLQAIIAAIKPETVTNVANKILNKFDIAFTIEVDYLIPILITALLLIYGGNWIVQYIRSGLMSRLVHRIISDKRNFLSGRSMDDDIFIIEQGPVAAQATEKCLEISFFIILILSLFIFVSPVLVVLLLPILSLLMAAQVLGDRAKLRQLKEQADAKDNYLNLTDSSGNDQEREVPADDEQRKILILAVDRRRHHAAIKPQSDTLIGAIAIVAIIYYLTNLDLSTEYLAGAMIFFVIGLRYVIAAGREMSNNVSRLLELRKHIKTIKGVLSNG